MGIGEHRHMASRANAFSGASRPHAVLLDLGGVIMDIDPRACFVSWARAAGVDIAAIAARWSVDDAYKAFEVGALPLYVFSNTNSVHQESWQSRFESALDPVRKIYASWEIGLRKPDVDSYLAVAHDIGVAPADILFVDDNPDNVAGGKSAGLDARLVSGPAETVAILREAIDGG